MSVDEIYAWAVLIACSGLAIGLARKGLAISMIHQTNETVHGNILTGGSEMSQKSEHLTAQRKADDSRGN